MQLPSLIAVVAFASVVLGSAAPAQPQNANRGACFFSREFQQWRAPDPNTILIRVGVNHFYRLDLAAPCRSLTFPSAHLVSVFHGSDAVCAPIDWDLRVSQYPAGVTEQCIVRAMTPLTPEQIASYPERLRP